ncbi:Replication factor A protein 2 [Recurvomyces mirabilis]|uniref:Replication factor A protein 2 n=1 Tax=Recurvomyces mirabilis TaxID=574656 RepID=A0AAE1C4M8_9PEZI|nr:Replication factor A protein 2 [Recurvomyces mirabilis]KAK5160495.1 Replication factor A protein 2 [Recurvomyces mirabilis]
MDYNTNNNYSTTSYSAGGGGGGGGFMPGSQNASDSPSGGKRSYGKDTLRPCTIKQLHDAIHPNPDAEYFLIDGSETTQITFVGQVRAISMQTTNVTYKLDDGTGIMEVKQWIDAEQQSGDDGGDGGGQERKEKEKVVEQGYVRVWGRLKAFNNKRHVGANIIRPIKDFNEIQYHLLEATVVHLHFTRGPPGELNDNSKGGAQNMNGNGGAYDAGDMGGVQKLPAGTSAAARKVYHTIANTPQSHEGLHVQQIAQTGGMEIGEVLRAGEELVGLGAIYTTVDEQTWALLDVN